MEERQSAEDVIGLLGNTFSFWNVWPKQILSDHGSEFYSMSGGKGSSKLDKWCERHGIEHIMGKVRHPQTQGKIERSHLSAKQEAPKIGKMDTLENARKTISKWVGFYNTVRTHQSLGQITPFDAFIEKLDGDFLDSFLSKY